jgi:hypothetical protein
MFYTPTNEQLLSEIKRSHELGSMTDKLGIMLAQICTQFMTLKVFEDFSKEWKESKELFLLDILLRSWENFNPETSNNPFQYFLHCISSEGRK